MELLLLHSDAVKEELAPVREILHDLNFSYADCIITENTKLESTVFAGDTELPSHILLVLLRGEETAWWVYYCLGYVRGTGNPENLCLYPVGSGGGAGDFANMPETVRIVTNPDELKAYLQAATANFSIIERRETAKKKIIEAGLALSAGCFADSVKEGKLERVKLYLDAGFSPDTKTERGVPMLNWAIRNEQYETFVLLLKAGADYNRISEDNGNTPLMEAVFTRDAKIIGHLLDRNCAVNTQNKNGQTALIVSVANGYTEIAEELIRKNADIGISDQLGMTARKYAELFHHTQIMTLLDPGVAS